MHGYIYKWTFTDQLGANDSSSFKLCSSKQCGPSVSHTYTYIIQPQKEILPLATTLMDFESVMVSEIYQTEKNKYCMFSLICRIFKKQKAKLIEMTSRTVAVRGCKVTKLGRHSSKSETSSCKINKILGSNA